MNDLLPQKPSDLSFDFLRRYIGVTNSAVPITLAETILKNYISFHKGNKNAGEFCKPLLNLEHKWYFSNCKDFSIYSNAFYFLDTWFCFLTYSRKYLSQVAKMSPALTAYPRLNNINSVLDLGCGVSYTTAILKQMYPNADVTGTNMRGTEQWTFNTWMAKEYAFNMKPDVKGLPQQDLVFASEYFEHIRNPLEHLEDVLNLHPKVLIIANAFNTRAMGHFENYEHGNTVIDQSKMQRLFVRLMRDSGYEMTKTKFWNNRPQVWLKK